MTLGAVLGSTFVQAVAFGFAILLFYGRILPAFGRQSALLAQRSRLAGRIGWARATDVWKLGTASLSQLSFLLLLIVVARTDLSMAFEVDLRLLALGALLGIAEMGAASLLAHVAIRLGLVIGPRWAPPSLEAWLAHARSGWMREYLNLIRTTPALIGFAIVACYVAVEELLFRVVVVSHFSAAGPTIAIGLSVVFFTVVQILHTPSWKAALFPVAGALVVGPVHAILYLQTGQILPLILAHIVFFFFAVA